MARRPPVLRGEPDDAVINRLQRAWPRVRYRGRARSRLPTYRRRAICEIRRTTANAGGSITSYTCVTDGGLRSEIRRNNGAARPVPVSGGEGFRRKSAPIPRYQSLEQSRRPTRLFVTESRNGPVRKGMGNLEKRCGTGHGAPSF